MVCAGGHRTMGDFDRTIHGRVSALRGGEVPGPAAQRSRVKCLRGRAAVGGPGTGFWFRGGGGGAEGVAEAWEHFVGIYRGYLRACAGAMLKRSASAPEAEELADSLFAELYGLSAEKRGSLLRYFHGRSSLKTWLRAVLAQRHVDKIRAGRKFEELGDEDRGDGTQRPVAAGVLQAAADPHRVKYLLKFTEALQTALDNLDARDVERLRMYYAEEKKLAEIGRALEEHE